MGVVPNHCTDGAGVDPQHRAQHLPGRAPGDVAAAQKVGQRHREKKPDKTGQTKGILKTKTKPELQPILTFKDRQKLFKRQHVSL